MSLRDLQGQCTLLRIFVSEGDRHPKKPLYAAILETARRMGLAGCTVHRGISGFGASGKLHSDFPPDYAVDLPIIVEVVDTAERTTALLSEIEPLLSGTLVTEERLHIHHYRHRLSPGGKTK
ncbi:MAG: DUF190 domain-containing protein [Deltaproteobacteria bacterium]|nr:DUF190 domain-containing protein [Deltaproteobacteria bacterium]